MNSTQRTYIGFLLLVVVSGLGGYILGERSAVLPQGGHRMPDGTMMMGTTPTMHDSMAGMMQSLNGKTGDDLDRAFLSEMIVHHQGAVDMAQAVLKDGKHPELQEMARAIVDAQTREIAQMKLWQKAWYSISSD